MINIKEIKDIIEVLPHRYPFLLIDRVTEFNDETGLIKGYKNITANEDLFNGHFPGNPVFPGVLMIEALAQLGAFFYLKDLPPENRMAYFAGIDKARFKRVVIPGDRLDLQCQLVREKSGIAVMEGIASVDGKVAVKATLMSSVKK